MSTMPTPRSTGPPGCGLDPRKAVFTTSSPAPRNVGNVEAASKRHPEECHFFSVSFPRGGGRKGGCGGGRSPASHPSHLSPPTHSTFLQGAASPCLLGNAPGGETLLWPPCQSSTVCFKLTLIFHFLCCTAGWRGLFRAPGFQDPAASSQV